jgi:DNA-binding NarL/FixJ family response regulator
MELPTVFQNIWLADDDQDDCEIFRDVINQILPGVTLRILPNGEELMNMLTTAVKPDILFLDINMPRKDGLDCLLEIRAQRHFSRLPIIIFSSSKEPRYIDASYGYGANLYYSKPTSFQELIAGLSQLFKMNWNDPYTITSNHYINNKFVAYSGADFN